jgi:hypothetical protein
MGHANVDTTLNVYTQVFDGSLREAVEKVGIRFAQPKLASLWQAMAGAP